MAAATEGFVGDVVAPLLAASGITGNELPVVDGSVHRQDASRERRHADERAAKKKRKERDEEPMIAMVRALAEAQADAMRDMSKEMIKRIKRRPRNGKHESDDDEGESDGEQGIDVPGLLRAYNLESLDVTRLPHMKVIKKAIEVARNDRAKGRWPVVSLTLGSDFAPVCTKQEVWIVE